MKVTAAATFAFQDLARPGQLSVAFGEES